MGNAVNVKQLETFITIVRLGTFAAAAEHLNATQSTVSARIQELEQDLGVVLFNRTQRKAHLTATPGLTPRSGGTMPALRQPRLPVSMAPHEEVMLTR
jgi:hypothetical protein